MDGTLLHYALLPGLKEFCDTDTTYSVIITYLNPPEEVKYLQIGSFVKLCNVEVTLIASPNWSADQKILLSFRMTGKDSTVYIFRGFESELPILKRQVQEAECELEFSEDDSHSTVLPTNLLPTAALATLTTRPSSVASDKPCSLPKPVTMERPPSSLSTIVIENISSDYDSDETFVYSGYKTVSNSSGWLSSNKHSHDVLRGHKVARKKTTKTNSPLLYSNEKVRREPTSPSLSSKATASHSACSCKCCLSAPSAPLKLKTREREKLVSSPKKICKRTADARKEGSASLLELKSNRSHKSVLSVEDKQSDPKHCVPRPGKICTRTADAKEKRSTSLSELNPNRSQKSVLSVEDKQSDPKRVSRPKKICKRTADATEDRSTSAPELNRNRSQNSVLSIEDKLSDPKHCASRPKRICKRTADAKEDRSTSVPELNRNRNQNSVLSVEDKLSDPKHCASRPKKICKTTADAKEDRSTSVPELNRNRNQNSVLSVEDKLSDPKHCASRPKNICKRTADAKEDRSTSVPELNRNRSQNSVLSVEDKLSDPKHCGSRPKKICKRTADAKEDRSTSVPELNRNRNQNSVLSIENKLSDPKHCASRPKKICKRTADAKEDRSTSVPELNRNRNQNSVLSVEDKLSDPKHCASRPKKICKRTADAKEDRSTSIPELNRNRSQNRVLSEEDKQPDPKHCAPRPEKICKTIAGTREERSTFVPELSRNRSQKSVSSVDDKQTDPKHCVSRQVGDKIPSSRRKSSDVIVNVPPQELQCSTMASSSSKTATPQKLHKSASLPLSLLGKDGIVANRRDLCNILEELKWKVFEKHCMPASGVRIAPQDNTKKNTKTNESRYGTDSVRLALPSTDDTIDQAMRDLSETEIAQTISSRPPEATVDISTPPMPNVLNEQSLAPPSQVSRVSLEGAEWNTYDSHPHQVSRITRMESACRRAYKSTPTVREGNIKAQTSAPSQPRQLMPVIEEEEVLIFHTAQEAEEEMENDTRRHQSSINQQVGYSPIAMLDGDGQEDMQTDEQDIQIAEELQERQATAAVSHKLGNRHRSAVCQVMDKSGQGNNEPSYMDFETGVTETQYYTSTQTSNVHGSSPRIDVEGEIVLVSDVESPSDAEDSLHASDSANEDKASSSKHIQCIEISDSDDEEETFASGIRNMPGMVEADISFIRRNRLKARECQYYVLKAWLRYMEPPIHHGDKPLTSLVSGICKSCESIHVFGELISKPRSERQLCPTCYAKGDEMPVLLMFKFRLYLIDENDDELIASVSSEHGVDMLGCTTQSFLRDEETRKRLKQKFTDLALESADVPLKDRGPLLKLLITPVSAKKGKEYTIINTYLC